MTPFDADPVLPYAGGSGHAGSDTSAVRAHEADTTGTTTERQALTLGHLEWAGEKGLTWRELGSASGWHHGKSSGALSNLHIGGRIARLTETRDRCKVYVLPEFVNGRPTEESQATKTAAQKACADHLAAVVETWLLTGLPMRDQIRRALDGYRTVQ